MDAWDFYCCVWDLTTQLLWKSFKGLWKSIPQEWPEHEGVPICIFYLCILWQSYWGGTTFSHLSLPTVSSLQSCIRLRVLSSPLMCSLIRLPVRFLYRCHHKSSTYMWAFCWSFINHYTLQFWLSLCIITAKEKDTMECNIYLTSSTAFTHSPSERE